MASAYAALVSLMQLIEQIQHHPRPPISLDKEQTQSLTEKVVFLQDFLETFNFHCVTKEAEDLMSRIAYAAYAAEDVIESRVVDQILAQSTTSHDGEKINSVDLYHGLQKVIEAMDLIKKEVMEIKDKTTVHHQQLRITTTAVVPSKSHSTEQNITVGFDDVLKEMLDKLTGEPSCRQIIPISGMGGIGKTTLARNVYSNSSIKHHFDVCAWVTVSQQYEIREILIQVLLCQNDQLSRKILSRMSGKELGEMLHKSLFGRRYFIIMDDMWDVEAWDDVKFYFPENNNGSRIVVTTRISKVVLHFANSHNLKMNFLDEDKSWSLFCQNVFGQGDCPDELEEAGKKIARKCKGLPLSIVAIGGLAKSKQTIEYWEFIAENLSLIVNLNDNERCLKILHTSYNQLPIHLKPCFLYMGIFPEDSDVDISQLIRQLVAEGFVKPSSSVKSLEETAERYLMDLSERNLLLVTSTYNFGQRKSFCKIHDLLRDLCIREAEKEKFLCVTSQQSLNIIPQGITNQRRIAINGRSEKENHPQVLHALESASLARSLMWNFEGDLSSLGFRLLRILKVVNPERGSPPVANIFHLVNSRYLDMTFYQFPSNSLPLSIYLLWNLQTLIVSCEDSVDAPSELWMMPLLRHVQVESGLCLPDPPSGQMDKQDDFIMENLQTLSNVNNFRLSEDVVKRIPNIKDLVISYVSTEEGLEVASHYCLNNLDRLHKLESLFCMFFSEGTQSWSVLLSLPNSLRELTLVCTGLKWEDMSTVIGSLPLLEVLNLGMASFVGTNWETIEGQFPSLKCLRINSCDLEHWTTESTHFPRLEQLVVRGCRELKEIPSCIGDIPTLELIELDGCSDSALISAKEIAEEQEEVGNEGLRVHATLKSKNYVTYNSQRTVATIDLFDCCPIL